MQSPSTGRGRSTATRQRPYSSSSSSSFRSRRPSSGSGYGGSRNSSGGNRRGGSYGGNRNRRSRGGAKRSTFDPSQFINKNPVELKEEAYEAANTFETFGLSQELVDRIHQMGFSVPSPIQDQIIPEINAGKDVIGLAQTGTGKTAAFLIPVIEKTLVDRKRQTLILAPTRELAIQINDELRKLTIGMQIFSTVCVGGMNIHPQIKNLQRTNHFIIGTPGRVMDLQDRGYFKPERMTTVVLDEADRMLDMGFIHDMRKIILETPSSRETLFFSATMTPAAKKMAEEFLKNPVMVSVKKKDVTNSIEQDVVVHGHHDKFETLSELFKDKDFSRVIIFGSMKHSVEKLSNELSRSGIPSESIHGNKSHPQRQRALRAFKSGQARVLVATDVAARGIHVDDVSHVINYDLPNTFEDYVHRIGRTGRSDKRGKALTFIAGR